MPTTEVTTTVPNEYASAADAYLRIIADAARDPNVDPAKLTALLELKERIDAKQAEVEFNRAFARLQMKIPRVSKNGKIQLIDKETRLPKGKPISFAKWEDVDAVIRPILSEEGFALSFSSDPSPDGVVMTGNLIHIMGHKRSSTMKLPPDAGPGRNALQAIGSSHSYGKRYITLDLINLITEGVDDDGKSAGIIGPDQADQIRTMMDASEMDSASRKKFLEFAEAPTVESIQKHRFAECMEALRKKVKQRQQGAR